MEYIILITLILAITVFCCGFYISLGAWNTLYRNIEKNSPKLPKPNPCFPIEACGKNYKDSKIIGEKIK